jgi:hypothetical protein
VPEAFGPLFLSVEFDNEVRVDIEWDLLRHRASDDLARQLAGVDVEPAWDLVSGHGFHVLAYEFLDLWLEAEFVANLDGEARAVDFLAVDADVAVNDHLASGPDRAGKARAADDVVEARFEELHEQFAGVTRTACGFVDVCAELLLEYVVVVAELLLLVETQAVVTKAAHPVAVHARGVELSL